MKLYKDDKTNSMCVCVCEMIYMYTYSYICCYGVKLMMTVEVAFYKFEFWATNSLQNQEIGRKSSLGHQGGAGQGGSDSQVSDYL